MTRMKLALLASAALAASTADARADELSELKAAIEALNARTAALEAAPALPPGQRLIAISEGEMPLVPGLGMSDRDRFREGAGATLISVLPTADAPGGANIAWSGYVRAGVVYSGTVQDSKLKRSYEGSVYTRDTLSSSTANDWDVKSRGQLRVVASTATGVGDVGVELKLRGDFNGNGVAQVYMKTAWGYWAMTPELTFGGGYNGSLGNIGYGYDGACTCYYTDNADVNFDPGSATQFRLSYAEGPFSMAAALEDAGLNDGFGDDNDNVNGQNLGVSGEIKYAHAAFSGEISAVYRSVNPSDYNLTDSDTTDDYDADVHGLWQVGAGAALTLGNGASLSLAAAFGSGPFQEVNSQGDIYASYPVNNTWWGVSGLASAPLTDVLHAEAGVGYKYREGDSHLGGDRTWRYPGFTYDTWAILGGLYYTPVSQLTLGLEGEWYTVDSSVSRRGVEGTERVGYEDSITYSSDDWTVDVVSVWRF